MPISGPESGRRHTMGEKAPILTLVVGVLGLAFLFAPVGVAQQRIDTSDGDPPRFPALSGNDRLGDPVRLQESSPMTSVWDGVFTEAQATRGQAAYSGACGSCHGSRLNGAPDDPDMRSSPPVARARFLRLWDGRSLGTLLAYTRATMPEENPNSLTQQEYVDVIAYQLSVTGMPVGENELAIDPYGLARIVIQPQP